MIKGKRILITGGGGFIGSWLIERFYKYNQITCFDNGRRNAFKFMNENIQKQINFIKGDVLDKKKVTAAVKSNEIILHLAAIAGASSYDQNPLLTLQVNLFGTANILEAAMISKPEKVLLFSTSETYGSFAKNVNEKNATLIGPAGEGRWSYAVSKLASDHLGLAYFKMHKLPVTIIRPFNVYGPRQVGEGAITNMFLNGLANKPINVTGHGKQKRAWCYISDLVDAVELMLKKSANGQIYNIGNSNEYFSIMQLARKISGLTGAKITTIPAVKSEIVDRLPDVTKATTELGFEPKVSLDTGLVLTKQWFEESQFKL